MSTTSFPPQKNRRVTRNDVAKLANVSPAVVSYVINGSKYVSPEKVAAVEQAIEALQYRPNMQARGLKTNRSMQIAFVCDNLLNYWLEGAEKRLFEQGYYVSHCYSRDGDDFIEMLIARQFDGVFMMSNRYSTSQLNRLAEMNIPVVLYKTRNYGPLDERIVTVVPDYRDGVVQSVNYLVMKGHTRIALILPPRFKVTGHLDDGFRISAYAETLRANGLEPNPELIFSDPDDSRAFTGTVMNMLLRTGKDTRPTAFIAGNDYMALRIVNLARQLGLRVPQDVAVVGCDNTYLAESVTPSITSVDFNKDEFCIRMADAMLALIRDEIPEPCFLPVSVCIRESV